ncbi:hypothetical protein AKJ62_02185 [candidate division MSBL1 archaeon SCGC-AAA259D14]|uniref:Hydantoinase A/oxoprolinase domain-containing protein n=2 Tax=candidate division MSBL1 TaxID=215777 RepID=A0A133U6Q8_9EURY|nr:hypothetical protein AKJ62_02185 [candidate division MSBL1 archaeon SCGC-AAA259D14]KXA92321.1 hypothetical protein AKJ66_04355 [candidate division MSBL1 archaeon SCGC-AAA259E22]
MQMFSLGLDVGGANTKAVLFDNGKLEKHWLEYIPLWKNLKGLKEFLENVRQSVRPRVVGVTMSGELSDVFESKREGVRRIVGVVSDVFSGEKVYYFSLKGNLVSERKALESPYLLSASNWVSSGLLAGREYPECLLIDVGSTTTDLVPINGGKPDPSGWSDYERLQTKELIYTGILRTPPPFLKSKVTVDGKQVGISYEYFANMADVYRVLGLLAEEDYTCETPDGRGMGKEECMRRLARLICSDLEELGEEKIIDIAEDFRRAQILQVKEGILEVANSHDVDNSTPVIVTGMGDDILGKKAAEAAGFEEIIRMSSVYGEVASLMTPAFSLGLLVSEEALNEGRD